MSLPFKTEVSAEARLGYQNLLLDYLRGERPTVVVAEQFETLQQEELAAHADAMDQQAASGDPDTALADRLKLVLALAVQRDLRYAMVGRRFLFAQGQNSRLREDFEVYAGAMRAAGGQL